MAEDVQGPSSADRAPQRVMQLRRHKARKLPERPHTNNNLAEWKKQRELNIRLWSQQQTNDEEYEEPPLSPEEPVPSRRKDIVEKLKLLKQETMAETPTPISLLSPRSPRQISSPDGTLPLARKSSIDKKKKQKKLNWTRVLPLRIICDIFKRVASTSGKMRTVIQLSLVCREWKHIIASSTFQRAIPEIVIDNPDAVLAWERAGQLSTSFYETTLPPTSPFRKTGYPYYVRWDAFYDEFCHTLFDLSASKDSLHTIHHHDGQCLFVMLADRTKPGSPLDVAEREPMAAHVDLMWYAKWWSCFAPRKLVGKPGYDTAFFDEFKTVCATGWFHGDLDRSAEAEMRLRDKSKGTFFVRLSSTCGYLTVSCKRSEGIVVHQRIERRGDLFWIKVGNEMKQAIQLTKLVESNEVRDGLRLREECEGNVFASVFVFSEDQLSWIGKKPEETKDETGESQHKKNKRKERKKGSPRKKTLRSRRSQTN